MTADRLFNLACEFAEACAKAEGWKVRAELDPWPVAQAEAAQHADTWHTMLTRKREQLRAALQDALPAELNGGSEPDHPGHRPPRPDPRTETRR